MALNLELKTWNLKLETWNHQTSLHRLVTNPTFLIPLYFIQIGGGTTGSFLHIYTNSQEEQIETWQTVCTPSIDRVHTIDRVSSDILLQVVLTTNRGCAHGQERMWLQTNKMYIYTIRLYKYAKLTARESRICTRLFFRTKIGENFEWWINDWTSTYR